MWSILASLIGQLVREPTVGPPQQREHRSGGVVVVVVFDGRALVDDVPVEETTVAFAERHDQGPVLDGVDRLLSRRQLT